MQRVKWWEWALLGIVSAAVLTVTADRAHAVLLDLLWWIR